MMNNRSLARVLVALAKRKEWRRIHSAADASRPKMQALMQAAFASGRKIIRTHSFKRALTHKDEIGVLDVISRAISASENVMREGFEQLLLKTLEAGALAAQRNLQIRHAMRAAAPAVKGFAFDVANPAAIEWARQHAAETIEGISERTRDDIRELVEESFSEQFDVDVLTEHIADVLGDEARAETIARTESMRAANQGQAELWSQAVDKGLLTGAESQVWIVTPDDRLCPICEPLDGQTVGLNEDFDVEGDEVEGPPAHPNCRCTIGLSV